MNDDPRALQEGHTQVEIGSPVNPEPQLAGVPSAPQIPDYLQETYWWAYLHPKALKFFEREWMVNLILWGNMNKLTQAVIGDMAVAPGSRILQVACVYGDFSNKLAQHLGQNGSRLEVMDVAPIQLKNAREKLRANDNIGLHHQDSTAMTFPAAAFDETVVFFLLHEQPEAARRKTIAEAIRVTRPGGKVIFVDYHGPKKSNPMRYVMKPILALLEPFAMDMWREELPAFFPEEIQPAQVESEFYFGGLYQKLLVQL
ncbi:MAG: rhodoquinone biosynthesis methyltransferase RquA [Xanthomonadales bacterium]|jgi:ubiquinone/menaquinone biosynthesis C-methylase UbiE|nr:rhodoquinone biosynthesis methyltransferase RquA [Xanthomonadales bacterium]